MRYLVLTLSLLACNGDKDGEETADTGDTNDTDDTDDTDTGEDSFNITGTAIDVATSAPAPEGLCIDLLDPSPVLQQLPPELLLSTQVGAGGAFSIEGVVTESTLGLLMSVKDCETEGATVFTSATGVFYDSYSGLADGETLADQIAFSISNPFLEGLELSAAAAQYAGDLSTDGFMFGFVLDSARQPLSGATVTCGDCGTTYYLDSDPNDGLFTTGTDLNLSTDATAGAAWIIPAGPVGSYVADDGGAHTFGQQLNGSNPGSATVTAFIAE
jgi:hypothetical protein